MLRLPTRSLKLCVAAAAATVHTHAAFANSKSAEPGLAEKTARPDCVAPAPILTRQGARFFNSVQDLGQRWGLVSYYQVQPDGAVKLDYDPKRIFRGEPLVKLDTDYFSGLRAHGKASVDPGKGYRLVAIGRDGRFLAEQAGLAAKDCAPGLVLSRRDGRLFGASLGPRGCVGDPELDAFLAKLEAAQAPGR